MLRKLSCYVVNNVLVTTHIRLRFTDTPCVPIYQAKMYTKFVNFERNKDFKVLWAVIRNQFSINNIFS